MTNKHIELPALARTLAYDVQAETIGPALADMISDTLNRCADAIAAHDQARVVGEPVARVNNDGFIVEIGDHLIEPGQLLYTHPYVQSELDAAADRARALVANLNIEDRPAPQEAQAEQAATEVIGYMSKRGLQALRRGNSPTVHAKKGTYDIAIGVVREASKAEQAEAQGFEHLSHLARRMDELTTRTACTCHTLPRIGELSDHHIDCPYRVLNEACEFINQQTIAAKKARHA